VDISENSHWKIVNKARQTREAVGIWAGKLPSTLRIHTGMHDGVNLVPPRRGDSNIYSII